MRGSHTEQQWTDLQLDELRAAGCDAACEEHISGADRTWPVLARLPRGSAPASWHARQLEENAHISAAFATDVGWPPHEPAPVGGNPGFRAGDPKTTQAATPPT